MLCKRLIVRTINVALQKGPFGRLKVPVLPCEKACFAVQKGPFCRARKKCGKRNGLPHFITLAYLAISGMAVPTHPSGICMCSMAHTVGAMSVMS